ncbi:CapA family protein [Streptomyces meridianus]|uniref:CapA family protein n=1 Tax=Streptomyces meridianus TaxID=2938945 RepID=A0ABT0X364_9ACTN|nr:CapA family protein [Streptomyces meridianus]MCM2576968.1 CapA family protein [Streptomyces meridianus]
MGESDVTLCFCGDVMLGRGVDQILPHPGDAELRESHVRDARAYVEMVEKVNGRVPRPAGFAWPWGEALQVLDATAPDVRVLNLETSVTRHDAFAPGKGVHYRMNPANLPCLAAAHPDVCVLANNHVLDFGRRGLEETLDALHTHGFRTAGAGRNAAEAARPAVVPLDGGGRVLVFACAMPSSGVPHDWAATDDRSGLDFVAEPSDAAASAITDRIRRERRPGDVVIVSVHWGGNWGYRVSRGEVRFAHALTDGGADVVFGHSSHHPRPAEIHRGRTVLYGCGDFVDDYEGISGHEHYRDDLRLLWCVTVRPGTAPGVRMVPLQSRRMRLVAASDEDAEWLRGVLDRIGRDLGSHVDREPDGVLTLRAARGGVRERNS